jgi:hypothetical protein
MGDPSDHAKDFEWSVSEDLIGEVDIPGTGESDLGYERHGRRA